MKRRMLTLTLLGLALACSERAAAPTEPAVTTDPVPDTEPPPPESSARGAMEALAREVALAMGSDAFRTELRQRLDQSPLREHKLPAAEFLMASQPALAQAALVSPVDPAAVSSLAGSTIPAPSCTSPYRVTGRRGPAVLMSWSLPQWMTKTHLWRSIPRGAAIGSTHGNHPRFRCWPWSHERRTSPESYPPSAPSRSAASRAVVAVRRGAVPADPDCLPARSRSPTRNSWELLRVG